MSRFAIYSAKVFTGNPARPWVEAVGVKDGVIAALGSNREVREIMGSAKDLALGGCLVSPGLVDAHCHFNSLGRSLLMVDFRNLTSLAECRARIREAAKDLKPGQWLLGRSWNHNMWEEGREPLKSDLDDIVPNNPAVMTRVCGHCQVVNSKVLEIMGITADTPNPPGGQYDRDESGEPNGLLREAAREVRKFMPEPTLEELKQATLAAQEVALKAGLTGVHTCESLAEWEAAAALEAEGLLKMRIHHLIQPENVDDAVQRGMGPGFGSDRLWIGHVKHFADGSLGAGTALMCEDYSDEPGCCGLPFLDLPELTEKLAKAYSHGFSVAIHAIGDLAGRNTLTAIAGARGQYPGPRRDRIEHVQIYCQEDLARYRDMDVVASVQPVFVSTDWAVAQRRWGAERCERAYNWKTLLNEGVRLQFGSDSPVEPIQPIYGLQAAVLRQTPALEPEGGWRPAQRLSLEEALSGFTATAAWTAGKEENLGSLKVGKWADLTVFEKDLSQVPAENWLQVDPSLTMIGGEIAFSK